jgi:hypothetical protein
MMRKMFMNELDPQELQELHKKCVEFVAEHINKTCAKKFAKNLKELCEHKPSSVSGAFIWSMTREKHKYWMRVHDKLMDKFGFNYFNRMES